jgi:four helix bundle protein
MRSDSFNVERSTLNVQRSKPVSARPAAYDLEERLLDFAARIIRLVELLPNTRAGNHVAGQLLRSGTSPLPNHAEAQAAESRDDFIHKFSICLKELRETRRWLRLIVRVPLLKDLAETHALILESEELIKIFARSIRTEKVGRIQRSKFNVERSTFKELAP